MSELAALDEFVYGLLSADATVQSLCGGAPPATRVYPDVAPEDVAMPAIVWQVQSPGQDTMALGGVRVMTGPTLLVRAVDQAQSWEGNLRSIADRIDALLHRASGPIGSGGEVYQLRRVSPWRLPEVANGVEYRHLGGLYAAWVAV